MSNIMGMIFCEAAALGVLLSGITLNTSLLGEMSTSDSERWLLPSAAVNMKNTATLEIIWSQSRALDVQHSEAKICNVPDLMFF